MYSSEDLERFYFQYQSEALPHGESIQSFCRVRQGGSTAYIVIRYYGRSKSKNI